MTVLLSYHDSDGEFVERYLGPRLRAAGISTSSYEENAQVGASRLAEKERLIRISQRVVAVLSAEYVADAWFAFDADLSQHLDPAARERKLLPILLKDVEIPPRLAALRVLDYRNPLDWDEQTKKLIDAAKGENNYYAPVIGEGNPMDDPRLLRLEERMARAEKQMDTVNRTLLGDEATGYPGLRRSVDALTSRVQVLLWALVFNALIFLLSILWNVVMTWRVG